MVAEQDWVPRGLEESGKPPLPRIQFIQVQGPAGLGQHDLVINHKQVPGLPPERTRRTLAAILKSLWSFLSYSKHKF